MGHRWKGQKINGCSNHCQGNFLTSLKVVASETAEHGIPVKSGVQGTAVRALVTVTRGDPSKVEVGGLGGLFQPKCFLDSGFFHTAPTRRSAFKSRLQMPALQQLPNLTKNDKH